MVSRRRMNEQMNKTIGPQNGKLYASKLYYKEKYKIIGNNVSLLIK